MQYVSFREGTWNSDGNSDVFRCFHDVQVWSSPPRVKNIPGNPLSLNPKSMDLKAGLLLRNFPVNLWRVMGISDWQFQGFSWSFSDLGLNSNLCVNDDGMAIGYRKRCKEKMSEKTCCNNQKPPSLPLPANLSGGGCLALIFKVVFEITFACGSLGDNAGEKWVM